MPIVKSVSMSHYENERIMNKKPKDRNLSEWYLELMMRGLDSIEKNNKNADRGLYAPFRNYCEI